MMSLNYSASID